MRLKLAKITEIKRLNDYNETIITERRALILSTGFTRYQMKKSISVNAEWVLANFIWHIITRENGHFLRPTSNKQHFVNKDKKKVWRCLSHAKCAVATFSLLRRFHFPSNALLKMHDKSVMCKHTLTFSNHMYVKTVFPIFFIKILLIWCKPKKKVRCCEICVQFFSQQLTTRVGCRR